MIASVDKSLTLGKQAFLLGIAFTMMLTGPALPVVAADQQAPHLKVPYNQRKRPQRAVLTREEQRIVDYLKRDWNQQYSVTSVDLAMASLGIAANDEVRFNVGNYLKTHPELHKVIRSWGWETLVLNENEKLLARVISRAQREAQPAPTEAQLAESVGIPMTEVKRGLEMLSRFKILAEPAAKPAAKDDQHGAEGYQVAARYVNWQPRLDFLFHTVRLSSGRQFNTN